MAGERGRVRRSAARVLASLALGVGLGACGDDPTPAPHDARPDSSAARVDDLRRVVPLWGAEQLPDRSGVAARLDESFDDVALPAGEVLLSELQLSAGMRYTVRVDHDGPAPELRAGLATDERLARLPPIPGPPRPGITQALLRPSGTGTQRLELRGAEGLVLRRLVVRAWGNAGESSDAESGPPWTQRVTVGAESRTGGLLREGEHSWRVDVPANATHLDLAVANPVDAQAGVVTPAPRLTISVRLDVGGAAVSFSHEHTPADHGGAWEPVRMSLGTSAGRNVEVRLAVERPDPDAGDALYVSNPVFACERGARRRNLVLVSIDTLRPDHLGHLGYERDTSPRLDALAADTVVFEQAMSTAPFTLPSHASLFSGQYPSTHGAEHPAHAVGDDVPWLASLLAEQGWATRAFTGGGYLHPDYGFARGFLEYSAQEPVFELPSGEPPADAPASLRALLAARRAVHWDSALNWIERHRELPFLLVLHTFAVHDYRPRAEHVGLFETPGAAERVEPLRRIETQVEKPYDEAERKKLVDLYDEALRGVDAHMGDLLDSLTRLGLDEHTLVVVTSDHGEILGEHELRGVPLVGHSWSLYDSLVRVPLMLRVPGVSPARIRERISSVDVAPTLLDLLGVEAPASMQGVSLRPWLEGRRSEVRPSPALAEIHSHYGHAEALVAGPHKIVLAQPDAPVQFPDAEPVRLFDLRSDPTEQRSVHGDQTEAAAALAETLHGLRDRLRAARAGDAAEADLGAETLEQLRALGYLDG